MELAIVGLINAVPSIIAAIQQMIARGRQTGELTPEQADALTTSAKLAFAQYSQPAPPPPGV
jgi:hypothetical protein